MNMRRKYNIRPAIHLLPANTEFPAWTLQMTLFSQKGFGLYVCNIITTNV